MNRLGRALLGLALLASLSVHATDSLINLETAPRDFLPKKTPDESSLSLWERFDHAFPERAEVEFSDTFHPFNMIKRDGEGRVRLFDERFDDTVEMANDALYGSVNASLRDAALAMNFPIMIWLRDQEDFFANLLWDSLDSVEEQSVSPLDLSYHQAERSWWNEVAKSSRLRFGLRPINTNPYAFLSWRLRNSERVWLLGHMRYRFRNFSDHSFELGLSLPLANRLSFDFGTCYRLDQETAHKSLVCKLTKYLANDAVLFAGVEVQSHPVLIAGVSTSW